MTEPLRLPSTPEAALRELDRIAHGSRDRLARSQELTERLSGLAGRAQSADGLVRAVCTPADHIHELHIDPRAMRRFSEDLAATIRAVVLEAKQDLERQAREVTREVFEGDDGPFGVLSDPQAAQAKLAELSELASTSVGDAAAVFERLVRQLRR